MKSLTHFLPLLSVIFCGLAAQAEVKPIVLDLRVDEFTIEVESAEITPENENDILERLTLDLQRAKTENPNSIIETGWFHPANPEGFSAVKPAVKPDSGRSPAQFKEILSRAQEFLGKLNDRLTGLFIESDRSFGLVDPKINAENSAYLRHSNAIYTTIRLTHSYAGRVATFVIAGYGLDQSLKLGLGVAVGCGVIAANYDRILSFVKNDRIYNRIKPGTWSWLDKKLSDPVKKYDLDRLHGKANWGLFEALFTVSVLGLESGLGSMLGLPVPFPSGFELTASFLAAFNSQQIWDRAVNRYQDLLNLQPNLNEDYKKAALRKRAAVGSVVSVVSMTASSMPFLPVKIGGFALLLGLRQAGILYEKRVQSRIETLWTARQSCNALLRKSGNGI